MEKLPPELFQKVARQLPKADLKSLSLVSKHTHEKVVWYLWSSITIRSSDEYSLQNISTKGFPHSYIPLASKLRFAAPFRVVPDFRCPHFYQTGRLHRPKSVPRRRHTAVSLKFSRLDRRARSFLEKFEKDQLRSFTWDMGCCVPETILGENGLLARMHPSLESIRLVNDAGCRLFESAHESTGRAKMDLSSFQNLRSICWRGQMWAEHQLLSTAIKNNAHHLVNLEVDLIEWSPEGPFPGAYYENDEGYDDNTGYFGVSLKLHQHAPQPVFQSLTSLVLAYAPLGSAMVDMINFEVLRSLTLRLCQDWPEFTQSIVKMGLPVKLKTLELHHDLRISTETTQADLDPFWGHPIRQSEVESLLGVCEGLEELFLNLPRPADAMSLWRHITRHEASLKRLMLHHRTPYVNRIHLYGDEVDLPNLGLTERQDRLYHPPLQNPLAELKLECISLCCFPDLAELMLKTSSSLPWLKLIHIRQTGRERQVFGCLAIDRGPYLIDRYERNNEGHHYINNFDGSYERIMRGPKTPEPRIPFPTILQPTFRSLAQWAFGPDGPPLLEAIAYGDFAYEGRANGENFILCPGSDGFRQAPKGGREWMGIVEKFRNALEACPTKPLLMWPDIAPDEVENW